MWILYLIGRVVLLLADQWTKFWALGRLSDAQTGAIVPEWNGELIDGVPHVFEFVYKSNTAGAMGIDFPWARYVLIVATILLIVVLAIYLIKLPKRSHLILSASCLLIAGGIGNLVDRIFRGYVPDFIRFVHNAYFPYVFNFADVIICIGAGLLALYLLLPEKCEEQEDNESTERSEEDGGAL